MSKVYVVTYDDGEDQALLTVLSEDSHFLVEGLERQLDIRVWEMDLNAGADLIAQGQKPYEVRLYKSGRATAAVDWLGLAGRFESDKQLQPIWGHEHWHGMFWTLNVNDAILAARAVLAEQYEPDYQI
jgi:hypothetical protein